MSKHTLEQVLEALINKEEDRASELLHQFFVAKGKSIYEELSQFDEAAEDLDDSEEEIEEGIGGNAANNFRDEVLADEEELTDEQLFAEDAEDGDSEDAMSAGADEPTEPEATADLALGGDEGAEGGAEGQAEAALDTVQDALEDLRAAFAEIMGGGAPEGDEAAEIGAEGGEEGAAGDDEFAAMGESVSLKSVPGLYGSKIGGDDGQNTKSPVATSKRISGNGAEAIKIHGDGGKGGTQGGVLNPSTKENNAGNVNKVGNAKAPALKNTSVQYPNKNTDTAGNKVSPVAKS